MREPKGWACLAPLAVLPRFQSGAGAPARMTGHSRFRFGSRLAAEIALLARGPADPRLPRAVVVLGSVPFYERAGFSAARARNLRSPYPIARTLLAAPGENAPEADLCYPLAFEG